MKKPAVLLIERFTELRDLWKNHLADVADVLMAASTEEALAHVETCGTTESLF